LHVGLVQEPSSFLADGWTDAMGSSYNVDAPVSEGLLWYRPNAQTANAKSLADFWQPWLATEIPTSENGDVRTSGCPNTAALTCITWKLRPGVTWQDGSSFGAHDVCETFQFIWGRYGLKGKTNPTGVVTTSGFDQYLDCREDAPLQATFDLKSRFGPYLGYFTGVGGILPAKQLDAALNADSDLEKTQQTVDLTVGSGNAAAYKGTDTLDHIVVGTGPYVLSSYTPTKEIVLVRNEHYWNKDHQPSLDKIVFTIEGDVQSELAAVEAGTLDVGTGYGPSVLTTLRGLAGAGKVTVDTVQGAGAEAIDLNMCAAAHGLCGARARQPAVLGDVRFRHAMLEAINRQSIVDTIMGGSTTVPQDSFLYLGAEYIKTADNPTTQYSVAQAASDLDAAGYRVGASCPNAGRVDLSGACITLNFVTYSGNPARAAAQVAIAQDLAKVGIATNQSQVTGGKLFGNYSDGGVLYAHRFDMAMYGGTFSAPGDPDADYASYHADCGGTCPALNQIPSDANSGQGQNDMGEDNPQVDADFDAARGTVDLSERTAKYRDAEIQLARDLSELPLYQVVTVNSVTTRLQGRESGFLTMWNAFDYSCTSGSCQG
jgi:ABC-type transport system substrate-binding protein